MIEVLTQYMIDRRLLCLKGQMTGHRKIKRRRFSPILRLIRYHHDVPLRLFQYQLDNLKELIGPRRCRQARYQCVKCLILWIQIHRYRWLKGRCHIALPRTAPIVPTLASAIARTITALRPITIRTPFRARRILAAKTFSLWTPSRATITPS